MTGKTAIRGAPKAQTRTQRHTAHTALMIRIIATGGRA
jgi:hypothetical protein